MNSFDVVAYMYDAGEYCPEHTVEMMIADGIAGVAARYMATEDVMWQCSNAMGIDADDLYSYDSSEFPKPLFRDQMGQTDTCDTCGAILEEVTV